jgi:hypothetical protein
MNDDVTDRSLIDVSGLSLGQLRAEVNQSALDIQLDRILAFDKDDAYSSFQASI